MRAEVSPLFPCFKSFCVIPKFIVTLRVQSGVSTTSAGIFEVGKIGPGGRSTEEQAEGLGMTE